MKRIPLAFSAVTLATLSMIAMPAHAITVYHQPMPMKQSAVNSINASLGATDQIVPHITDGYIYYCISSSGCTFTTDQNETISYPAGYSAFLEGLFLPVGIDAQGGLNLPFVKFDTRGLPTGDSLSLVLLYQEKSIAGIQNVSLHYPSTDWDTSMTVDTIPPDAYEFPDGLYHMAGDNQWFPLDAAVPGDSVDLYAPAHNYGLWLRGMHPAVYFRSSQYVASENGPGMEDHRPILQLTFTPTLELKLPLPADATWQLRTEVGAADCSGLPDIYHVDSRQVHDTDTGTGSIMVDGGYFAIDIGDTNKSLSETQSPVYSVTRDPDTHEVIASDIPVLAASRGKIRWIGHVTANPGNWDIDPASPGRGNYVIIDHVDDSNNPTGFSTRYSHMHKISTAISVGDIVPQGKKLGLMGNSGISSGPHLHFGVAYRTPNGADSSKSNLPELQKVVMEGLLLKSYQTECSANGNWIRYYGSTNTTIE